MVMRRLMGAASLVALLSAPAAAETLKIGHINTFSGGAAIFGTHQKDGLELALKHLGGKIGGLETQIIYGDDQRKPDVGKQVADKMVKRDKVHFVTGIIWSNILAAVQRGVVRSKTFLISTNAGWSGMAGKQCSPYFFSTSWQNDQTPEAMGKLMQDEGVENVFMLSANYQAGKDMLNGFQRYYKGKILGQKLYRLGQRDFAAEISQIRAVNPKAIFAFVPGGMGVAFAKQWAASGLADKIKFYEVFSVNYLTLKGVGDSAVGSFHTSYWGPDLDNPANKKFVADFEKTYGYTPSIFSAQAYDMPFLVDSAVKAVKGNLKDKKGIIAAMRKADYKSTRGPYTYNTNHFPIQNFYKREVIKDSDGKVKIVTRGVVFKNHKDSFYKQCKMPKP